MKKVLIFFLLLLNVLFAKPYSGTIADFVGINSNAAAFDRGIVERLAKVAKWVREYHRWEWYEQMPNVYGWDDVIPGFNGSAWPYHTKFVEACLKNNINIVICNERTAVWSATNGVWNNPPHGQFDGSKEDHYVDKAEFIAQQVARYGSQKIDAAKLQTRDKLSGLNYIKYFEDENEPDQWWWTPGWPAEHYAKYLNAVHDGYNVTPNAGYPLIGLKNVDPNAVHVLGGMNGDDIDYLDKILANTDGRVPFEILNFHHYCSTSLQDSMGVCPEDEEFGLKKTIEMWTTWRDHNVPGMPIWCTEFGYDTFRTDSTKDSYIYTTEETQANYLLRSLFVLMHYGINKGFIFYDVDPDSDDPTQFSSSGIMTDSEHGLVPKTSFYYLATLQNVLADYSFVETEQYAQGSPAVYSYKLKSPDNNKKLCYVLYCRNPKTRYDDGTTIPHFKFEKSGIQAANCFEPLDNDEWGRQVPILLQNNGKKNSSITLPLLSEKPIFLFVEFK